MFAGQRLEGFYVDLGAIFDLGDLRPFEKYHVFGAVDSAGVDGTHGFGVHSIALKVPKRDLSRSGRTPTDPTSRDAVIGIWASASRQQGTVRWSGATPCRSASGSRSRGSATR